MKVGQLIRQKLLEDGRTVTWFATQICCARTHVYKIFDKTDIDTGLLMRISRVLKHDFFKDFSREFSKKK